MLRFIFISLLLIINEGSFVPAHQPASNLNTTRAQATKQGPLLKGIQSKIYSAFGESFKNRNDISMTTLSQELKTRYNKSHQKLILYWRSYLQLYLSIYQLKNGEKKSAEKEIDKGIEMIQNMQKKNSEDYALLALLQEFGIQFKGNEAMFISKEIIKNATTAIAIDSTNLRAYYVFASNDFYTPEKYGGGRKAEKYLLKAISLPSQKIKNDYLPSWGKTESYEMLIKLYIRQKKWTLAKKYFQEATKKYPGNYNIRQLSARLMNK